MSAPKQVVEPTRTVSEKESKLRNLKWIRDGNATNSSTLSNSLERGGVDTNTKNI